MRALAATTALTLLAVVLALTATRVACADTTLSLGDDDIHTDTVFIDDADEPSPPWETIMSGGSGPAPTKTSDDVEDAEAANAAAERRKEEAAAATKKTQSDMQAYADAVERFEQLTNDWCCAVTGKPLYTVSGDTDVMNYMFYFLSQTFDAEGQQYGGRLVLNYHLSRNPEPHRCVMVRKGEKKHYESPVLALLELREGLNAWLTSNEVDPSDIVGPFIKHARPLYGRFVRSRMLFAKTANVTIDDVEEAVLKTIALTDVADAADYCTAGGEYHNLVPDARGTAKHEIDSMLATCMTNGKLAENPVEFGEVLLDAGREREARKLFDLAVERGVICNSYQRPDAHHRKDLIAQAVFPASQVAWMVDHLKPVRTLLAKDLSSVETAVLEAGDWLTSKPDAPMDSFARFPVYSQRFGLNGTLCQALGGDDACDAITKAADKIRLSHDGYDLACNGSLTIEIWAIRGGTSRVPRTVGATNLVIQAVAPLRMPRDSKIRVQMGEDSAEIRPDAPDFLVFDDSFEHTFAVEGRSTVQDILTFLHAQICHPDMHEKALDQPTNECAAYEDE